MKKKIKSRLRRYKPKKLKALTPAYTVTQLQKMNNKQLVAVAKALAVDYRMAQGEEREALGKMILYIRGLVEKRQAHGEAGGRGGNGEEKTLNFAEEAVSENTPNATT